MEKMGLGQRWRDMISLLFASSSSRVLLNGVPGSPLHHRRGLRQGDPLSPVFILSLEPLQRLFDLATEEEILSPLKLRAARICLSFYADDAALFINPIKEDISGLKTNLLKCVAYPIACNNIDMQEVLQGFGGKQGSLPCTYLGLPLGIRKPRRVDVQPLLDCLAAKLKGWKGKILNRKGRLALINSVITATATYYLTAFPADAWLIKQLDKIRRQFLWASDEEAKGAKCLVIWKKICAPLSLGGLGIKNVQTFG